MIFQKDYPYTYEQIEEKRIEKDLISKEYGDFYIGQHAIHLTDDSKDYWFVLSAYSKKGIYTCVYGD